MNRRNFLRWAGVGLLASSLPVAIAACTPDAESDESTANTGSANNTPGATSGEFQVVGTVSNLDSQGQLLVKDGFAAGPVLIVRNPELPDSLVAVNAACTHAGCDVEWQSGQAAFICPCHDSRFSVSGQVLQGPADEPLKSYEAKVEGDEILVKET